MSINANVPFMGPTGVTSDSSSIQILKQKERVLDHVLYEMYIFLWTTKSLKELFKNGIVWKNSPEYNAYYIAQKCSLRNILEFFSSKHPKTSNATTSDIYFGKIYKIRKFDEEIISSNDALDIYRLFPDNFFDTYFNEACGRKYYGKGDTIKDIVNKTVSHLTDKRFDWGDENFEQIINEREINDKIIQDVKAAIKVFLKNVQSNDNNYSLYYVYEDSGVRKSKNLSDELREKEIETLLEDIKLLIK